MIITNRKHFAALRDSYFAAMRQAARQGSYERRVGATTSAPATAAGMEEDYPKLQAISGLTAPTEADFREAAEIFERHGILA